MLSEQVTSFAVQSIATDKGGSTSMGDKSVPDGVSTVVAAIRLGVRTTCIRDAIKRGALVAVKGDNGRWVVDERSLRNYRPRKMPCR